MCGLWVKWEKIKKKSGQLDIDQGLIVPYKVPLKENKKGLDTLYTHVINWLSLHQTQMNKKGEKMNINDFEDFLYDFISNKNISLDLFQKYDNLKEFYLDMKKLNM